MCRACPRCGNRRNIRGSRTGVSCRGSLRGLPPGVQKLDWDAEGVSEGRNVKRGEARRVATPGVFVRADSKGVTGAFFVRADYRGLRASAIGKCRLHRTQDRGGAAEKEGAG